MIGKYQHTIDAKGRVFVPAPLRKLLGEEFYVTICGEKCLQIYTLDKWEQYLEKLNSMKQNEQKQLRPIFSYAAHCVPDGQGRIQLPAHLRTHADLTKNVTILGTGNFVQIWDADTFAPIDEAESSPDNIAEALANLDF